MLAVLGSLNLSTDKPARLGGTVDSFYGAPGRLVADVQVDNAASVRLHRYSPNLGTWVPSLAGAVALSGAGTWETRWDTAGVEGDYCLLRTAGVGQGTWDARVGT